MNTSIESDRRLAFRESLRRWLQEHVPTDESSASVSFRRMMYDSGYFGVSWPTEYGGRGLESAYQEIVEEELALFPDLAVGDLVTIGICAPTLRDFGSEEQKTLHIPRMLRGDETWTQLLSEPGAGSDLAGLQTRAERDGEEWIINGQKVWTSAAQSSDFAILVARTDWDVPKHRGLSMFIVDLRASGVTIRPLKQMTGDSEFNEVFLDDVRLPTMNLVGKANDGWSALTRMLMHERVAIGAGTGGTRMGAADMFPKLVDLARRRNVDKVPAVREALVDVYIKEQLLSWMGHRLRAMASDRTPGAEGSVVKLLNAIVVRASANAGMFIGGPGSQAWRPEDSDGDALAGAVLSAPMTAIAGGTSEIQRNIIGERILGLPREPRSDVDVPFRSALQNPVRNM